MSKDKSRTELLMQALGWQGGTVHDLCKEIGVNVHEFLYNEPRARGGVSDHNLGLYFNSLSMEARKGQVKEQYSKLDYWIGASDSFKLVNAGLCQDHAKRSFK